MPGMVKVRLSGPDVGTRAVLRIEFVIPAAITAVDEMTVTEFPEQPVPLLVLHFTRAFDQCTGGGTGFAMGPVQAMADHRFVVPVQGVDNPRRAIDVPAVTTVVLEELLRCLLYTSDAADE